SACQDPLRLSQSLHRRAAPFVCGRVLLGPPDRAGDQRAGPLGRLHQVGVDVPRRRLHDRDAVPVVRRAQLVQPPRHHVERPQAYEHLALLPRQFIKSRATRSIPYWDAPPSVGATPPSGELVAASPPPSGTSTDVVGGGVDPGGPTVVFGGRSAPHPTTTVNASPAIPSNSRFIR